MTKTFTNQAAQGDMMLRRIDKLPEGLIEAKTDNDHHILAFSETMHHHVIDKSKAQLLIDKTNEFIAYLKVSESCDIQHLRTNHTHEAITVQPGIYEVRRQREYVADGFRRAQD